MNKVRIPLKQRGLHLFSALALVLTMLSPAITPVHASADFRANTPFDSTQVLPNWWRATRSLPPQSRQVLPSWWPPAKPIVAPPARLLAATVTELKIEDQSGTEILTKTLSADDTFTFYAVGYGVGFSNTQEATWTLSVDSIGSLSFTRNESTTLDAQSVGTAVLTATHTVTPSLIATATITVTFGALHHFDLTAPASATAGDGFSLSVTAEDSDNNTVTDFAQAVTLTVDDGSIAPTLLSGIDFSLGVWNDTVTVTKAGTGRTITATRGVASGTAILNVSAGELTTITVAPDPVEVIVGETQQFTADGVDQYENPVTITPSWDTDVGNISATGLLTAQDSPPATGVVTASDSGVTGTATVTVVHGPVDHFYVGSISTQTAGVDFGVTIEARDVYSNVATSYDGTAVLTDSTRTVRPTAITFSDGVWNQPISVTQASSGVRITVTHNATTGNSNAFTIVPGALDRFTLAGAPVETVAGQSFVTPITVTAFDAWNNVKTNYTGDVYFTSTDSQADLPYTSGSRYSFTPTDAGVHSFSGAGFTLYTSGNQNLRITDGSVFTDSDDITVHPASFYSFTLTGYPAETTAGISFAELVTVTAYDVWGNVKTDYTGTVYFASDDPLATLPYTVTNPYTFLSGDNGSKAFAGGEFTLYRTSTRHITATNGITPTTSDAITVHPGGLDYFTMDVIDSPQRAGTPFNITVRAWDAWNNLKTDYGNQPQLSDTTGTILPTQMGSFAGGVRTESVTITRAQAEIHITVTDGITVQSSNAFTVTPAPLDHILIRSAAGGGGSEVGDRNITVYDTLTLHTAGYDQYENYRQDYSVEWTAGGVLSTGKFSPPSGVSTTFTPAPILSGTGSITATYVPSNEVDSTGIVTVRAPWLLISKSANRDLVSPGDPLVYTIIYTNVGNAAAQNVRITETYDNNISFSASSPDPETGYDNLWLDAALGINDSASIIVFVNVAGSLPPGTILTNVVDIGGPQVGTLSFLMTTPVTSTPALTVSLSDLGNDPINAGDTFNLQVTYANSGTAPVDNIVLTLTLDSQVTFQSATINPVVTPTQGTGNVGRWELGSLDGGDNNSFFVTVESDDFIIDQALLINDAVIQSDQTSQAYDSEGTRVNAPLLLLSKTASSNPVAAFTRLTYTLVYSNVGHTAASALHVTDAVPANTDYVNCLGASCSQSGGIVTWQPGPLAAGADGVVTLVVDVHRNLDPGTVLTNHARVRIFATPAYSASAQITTTVVSSPSLWLLIDDGRTSVEADDDVVYTLYYGNIGNGRAYSTTIVAIPPSSQHVGGVGCLPSVECSVNGGNVTYDLGTVDGGQSGQVRLVARVHDPLPAGASSITTSATIDTVTPGDPGGDNASQDVDTIATRPDVQISVDYSSHTPYPGKRITYTIYYSNTGHINTTGVVVTATQPQYTTYDAAASSTWQDQGSGNYTYPIGTLDYDESGVLLFVVTLPTGHFTMTMPSFDAAFGVYDSGISGPDSNTINNTKLAPIGVPDIVVDSIEVNWSSLLSGQSGQHVTVTLRNLGGATACNSVGPDSQQEFCGPFFVDVYVNPDPEPPSFPSGPPYGIGYSMDGGPILPGQTQVVPIYPFALPSGAQPPLSLYVRVDNFDASRPYGLVAEYNELNNVFGPEVAGYSLYLPVVLRNH